MPDNPPHDARMSLGDHLEELRARIILGLVGIGVCAALALFVGKHLILLVTTPLTDALRDAGLEPNVHNFNPADPFTVYLKVSLVVGVIVAAPWVLYQLWKFVSVGMYATERRVVLLLVPFSVGMAALGVLFMYYVMLPICLWFFISFAAGYPAAGEGGGSWLMDLVRPPATAPGPEAPSPAAGDQPLPIQLPIRTSDPVVPEDGDVWINGPGRSLCVRLNDRTLRAALTDAAGSLMKPIIGVKEYISFVTMLTLGIVVAFQLPVAMLVLGWTGLIPPALVTRYRPHCVFGCFALGMILTPADPLSMLVLAFPLWGLFELGVLVMKATYRRARSAGDGPHVR